MAELRCATTFVREPVRRHNSDLEGVAQASLEIRRMGNVAQMLCVETIRDKDRDEYERRFTCVDTCVHQFSDKC
jgi:hypothetical protein